MLSLPETPEWMLPGTATIADKQQGELSQVTDPLLTQIISPLMSCSASLTDTPMKPHPGTAWRKSFLSTEEPRRKSGALTIAVNEVGQVEVQLPDRHWDVVWVDTEVGVHAFRRLLQPLTICALQGNGLEEDDHHQIQPPDFVRLSQTVDASHLALLVGVAEHTYWGPLPSHTQHKVLTTFLRDVLTQLGQKPRSPLLFDLWLLTLQHRNQDHKGIKPSHSIIIHCTLGWAQVSSWPDWCLTQDKEYKQRRQARAGVVM